MPVSADQYRIATGILNGANVYNFSFGNNGKLREIGDYTYFNPYTRETAINALGVGSDLKDYRADISFTQTRGKIFYKENTDKYIEFQFNPTELHETYNPVYTERDHSSRADTQYVWNKGTPHTMEFDLFFDATQGSDQQHIGKHSTDKSSGSISNYNVETHNADRGILDQVEFFKSLVLPYEPRTVKNFTPEFLHGNFKPTHKFYPPPEIIFVFGNFYFEGVVVKANPIYDLFNYKLIPIRGNMNIEIRIIDGTSININNSLLLK